MIKTLLSKVKSIFKKKSEPENINFKVLAMAASQIGTKESKSGSNAVVEEYLDYGKSIDNKNSGLSDDVPWCAGFVAWCLEKCGRQSTNSLMARSYEKWGVSVQRDPLPGDIVVFYRGKKADGFGHVGFFLGFNKKGNILCLGGNQNDSVNVTEYSPMRMTDIRRSSKAPAYNDQQLRELIDLKEKIINGYKISPEGSVV